MTDKREEQPKKDGFKDDGIKRERVEGSTIIEEGNVESKDTGKKHPFRQETFTEKEIDSVHLVKIAPMFYFCPDNYKVYLIPFTIQFSMTEILQLCAKIATNLEKMATEIQKGQKVDEKKN